MVKRVLGLDLSMSCAGFGVIDIIDGKATLLHATHAKTNVKRTHGERLIFIADKLRWLVNEFDPINAIAREKGFSRHANTTQVLFKVVGVSDYELARNGHTVVIDIAPTTVKKLVAGNGKASKAEVQDAVREWLELPDDFVFANEDESDACAVALAYGINEGLIY